MIDSNSAMQEELYPLLGKILNMEYLLDTRLENIQKALNLPDSVHSVPSETGPDIGLVAASIDKLKDRIKRLEKAVERLDQIIDNISSK